MNKFAIRLFGVLSAVSLQAQDLPSTPAPSIPLEYLTTQRLEITIQSEVPSVPKLKAKAISILRTRFGLSLAEAQEKLTLNGMTNVSLCNEYLIIDALAKVSQVKITANRQQRLYLEGTAPLQSVGAP